MQVIVPPGYPQQGQPVEFIVHQGHDGFANVPLPELFTHRIPAASPEIITVNALHPIPLLFLASPISVPLCLLHYLQASRLIMSNRISNLCDCGRVGP